MAPGSGEKIKIKKIKKGKKKKRERKEEMRISVCDMELLKSLRQPL